MGQIERRTDPDRYIDAAAHTVSASVTHQFVGGRSDIVELGLQAASVFLRLRQLHLQSFTDLQ